MRDWVTQALQAAQEDRCDFLGLRQAALRAAPDRAAADAAWRETFPTVPVTVTVDGRVDRSYDLAE